MVSTTTVAEVVAASVTFFLVRVFPKFFSRVLWLLCSDTILKAINTKPRLAWKPENQEKNHDVFSFIIFSDNYNSTNEGT